MDKRELIGKRIEEKRTEAGMTQAQLGDKVGISQSHIARIEKGLYDTRIGVILKIADALRCTIDDFVKE